MAGAERVEVGDDAGERGPRLRARLAARDPGPLLGLGRLQRARQRSGQAGRQHAVVDEAGGADRQRGLDHVVAAEDEVAETEAARLR